jgi:hypothetical protein
MKNNLKLNFSFEEISVPFNGIVTSRLEVLGLEKAKPGSYTVPIFSKINITTESKPRRTFFTGKTLINPMPQNFSEISSLTETILPPLTISEYIDSVLMTWLR